MLVTQGNKTFCVVEGAIFESPLLTFDVPTEHQSNVGFANHQLTYMSEDNSTRLALMKAISTVTSDVSLKSVVDIGASYGFLSVLACFLGAQEVWAYEPHPVGYSYLVRNFRKNLIIDSRLNLFQAAVWDKTGCLLSFYQNVGPEQSGFFFKENVKAMGKVLTISLEDVLRVVEGEITLLKIDTEGSEHLFLPKASPELFQKVRYCHIEVHETRSLDVFSPGAPWMDIEGKLLPSLGFVPTTCLNLWKNSLFSGGRP